MNSGASTSVMVESSLISTCSDGPAVSLNGSPTVSPTTAALCASDRLPTTWPSTLNCPDSMYFFAFHPWRYVLQWGLVLADEDVWRRATTSGRRWWRFNGASSSRTRMWTAENASVAAPISLQWGLVLADEDVSIEEMHKLEPFVLQWGLVLAD